MSPIVTTMSAPAGRARRVKAPTIAGVTPTIYRAHDFADGGPGNFGVQQFSASVTYPVDGAGRVARFTSNPTSALTGNAFLEWSFTEQQTRDGEIYLSWTQRYTATTLSQVYTAPLGGETGRQIKTHLARRGGEYEWAMVGTGYTFYGSASEYLTAYAQDYGIAFLPAAGNPGGGDTKYSAIVANTFDFIQLRYRKFSATTGGITVWVNGTQLGGESAGGNANLLGDHNNASSSHAARFGIAFFQHGASGDAPYVTDVGKVVCSNYLLTQSQFNAQASV